MEGSTKFKCTNCQEEIIGIRIKCVQCINYDSCLQCFASGSEIGSHESNHAYKFLGFGNTPLLKSKNTWSVTEEVHLLDAIEQFGFGNWEDISKHIETRTPEEAKEKYMEKYLDGPVGIHTWIVEMHKRPILKDHTLEENGPLSPSVVCKLPPLEISPEEANHLGYMTNRADLEREYDPSAENIVSILALQPEDEENDLLLKLAHIDIYQRRIRERARRKRLAHDYQLAANFFRGYMKRIRQSRDQREFRERLRTFAQFYTCYEFEKLVNSLERERALRIRLSELNRYRYNGISRLEDAVHFENHVVEQGRQGGPFGHGRTHTVLIDPNGEKMGVIRQMYMGQPRLKKNLRKITQIQQSILKTKKKRRNRKIRFHRPKNHVPHRRPGLIRRIIAHSKLLSK